MAFLPANDAPTTAPIPAISSSACIIVAAVLPDLPAEEVHDLGGGRDRVAAEELAAREEGGGGAHVVAVHDQLALLHRLGRRGQGARLAQRVRLRVLHAGGEGVLVALHDLGALLAELLPEPGEERLAADPQPAREEAEDDGVLGLLGARVLLRHLGDRHGDRLPGRHPGQREPVRRHARSRSRRRRSCGRPPAARRRTSGSRPSSGPPPRRGSRPSSGRAASRGGPGRRTRRRGSAGPKLLVRTAW